MVRLNNNGDNNYNNYANSLGKLNKGDIVMENNEQVFKKIVNTSNEMLANLAERLVPENGKFNSVAIDYKLPKSNNMAKVMIECDLEDPKTQRRISVGVHHKDRDRLISNYICKGTKKEVLDYLKAEENKQTFFDTINELSAKTNEYYDNI